MSKLNTLRQALGKAKDDLAAMKETGEYHRKLTAAKVELRSLVGDGKAFDAKEGEIGELAKMCQRAEKAKQFEIDDIEVEIQREQDAVTRSASQARPVQNEIGGFNQGVDGFATLRSLATQLRAVPRNVDGKVAFGDALSIARSGLGFAVDRTQHYGSLGEQLQAIFQHYASKGSSSDSRLIRAPTGAGEVDPTGGGFLIQTDFAAAIFMLAHDMGDILGRVNSIPISANSNGLALNAVDETSRATGSRWGGVQSFWAAEGTQPTASKPKFRNVKFDLKKLMSLMWMTDELLQDSTALTSIAGQAFSEEVMFMTEDAIWEGSGAGQPLGMLNAPCTVVVPKVNGQTAGTIVKENIDAMWSRMWPRSRKSAVWYINQDCEPQLNSLNQAVGTGGQLVYLPPGGLSGAPYASLYGRPMIATEYNSALGAPGDIVLADFSQYTMIDKGGVQAATSMHVAFLTDEMVFRITYRVDGKPMWSVPITPFKGGLTKSPFITLGQR